MKENTPFSHEVVCFQMLVKCQRLIFCCLPIFPLFMHLASLYVLFLKGQGHQDIFSLVKGILNCKFLLEHLEGTKAMTSMTREHGGNRLREVLIRSACKQTFHHLTTSKKPVSTAMSAFFDFSCFQLFVSSAVLMPSALMHLRASIISGKGVDALVAYASRRPERVTSYPSCSRILVIQ